MIKDLLLASKEARGLDDVHSLAIVGQQHGLICLDRNGKIIQPARLWNDMRSATAIEELVLEKGKDWWAKQTGVVPVASIIISKMRWIALNEPELVKQISAICLLHD